MGDGLLTIDGDFHRSSRRIMLPAFHREQLEASVSTVIEETERAVGELVPGPPWTCTLDQAPGDEGRDAGAVRGGPRR